VHHVSIIQHPSGERKQLALRENQLIDVLEDFLHYRTDTAPGSSGSPVFNDHGNRGMLIQVCHSEIVRDGFSLLMAKFGLRSG
jgi:hypothetical protein